jgi:hypothetical protein
MRCHVISFRRMFAIVNRPTVFTLAPNRLDCPSSKDLRQAKQALQVPTLFWEAAPYQDFV